MTVPDGRVDLLVLAAFAEPAAVVIFGAILVLQLRAMRRELVQAVREEFGLIQRELSAMTDVVAKILDRKIS